MKLLKKIKINRSSEKESLVFTLVLLLFLNLVNGVNCADMDTV